MIKIEDVLRYDSLNILNLPYRTKTFVAWISLFMFCSYFLFKNLSLDWNIIEKSNYFDYLTIAFLNFSEVSFDVELN